MSFPWSRIVTGGSLEPFEGVSCAPIDTQSSQSTPGPTGTHVQIFLGPSPTRGLGLAPACGAAMPVGMVTGEHLTPRPFQVSPTSPMQKPQCSGDQASHTGAPPISRRTRGRGSLIDLAKRSQALRQAHQAGLVAHSSLGRPASGKQPTCGRTINFCPFCGGKASSDFRFCQFCGSSLQQLLH